MHLQEKIARLGTVRDHRLLTPDTVVRVDEKIDGSQITFGFYPNNELIVRSRSSQVYPSDRADRGIFATAVESLRARADRMRPGLTYHGEYLQRPRHNVLVYDRVPAGNIVLFDVVAQTGHYLDPVIVGRCAEELYLEPVQMAYAALKDVRPDYFPTSQLGGMSEGVVIKWDGPDGRVAGKLVRPEFAEVKGDHTTRSRANPANDNVVACANKFCSPARFHKAVQRLKERGELVGDRSDIGRLRKEVSQDLEAEEQTAMALWLYESERKRILREALAPITAWYDQYLTNDNAYWDDVRSR